MMIKGIPLRALPILSLLLCGSFAQAQDVKPVEAFATVNGLQVSLGYDDGGKVLVVDLHNTSVHAVELGYHALELQRVYAVVVGKKIQAAEAFPLPLVDAPRQQIAPGATASGRIRLPAIDGVTSVGGFWCYADIVQFHHGAAMIDLCIPAKN